jgi:hypothetical protein
LCEAYRLLPFFIHFTSLKSWWFRLLNHRRVVGLRNLISTIWTEAHALDGFGFFNLKYFLGFVIDAIEFEYMIVGYDGEQVHIGGPVSECDFGSHEFF